MPRAPHRRGRCPVGTIRSGAWSTGALRTRRRTRAPTRHGGNSNAIPTESPADLYSNSTIALDPDTGKLRWYYQHLPGDDWDEDYTNERTLLRTAFNPDPKFVKWINPDVKRGEQRDVAVMVGEGGGIFVIDRGNGQFLWGHPFPFDTPDFLISNIDGKTGRVSLNKDKLFTGPCRSPRHLLLEHAQLLADGVSSRRQLAVRPVCRELPRHDVGRAERRATRASRRHSAAGVGSRTRGPA